MVIWFWLVYKNVESLSFTGNRIPSISSDFHWNVSIAIGRHSWKINDSYLFRYIVAILEGHVVPNVPYISDAATYSPESCIFGQLINIGAVLLGVTIYVRFRQIKELLADQVDLAVVFTKNNKVSMWIGFLSCLGISIVGNFQETNVRIVHYVGAMFCFGCGTIYFWMQATLSYALIPELGSRMKAHIRLGMAVVCTILFIVLSVTGIISHILFRGDNPRKWWVKNKIILTN